MKHTALIVVLMKNGWYVRDAATQVLKKRVNVTDAVSGLRNWKTIYAKAATVIYMASKISKACDISPKVRQEVIERDKCCIVCGGYNNLQIAHYVSRARLGLGKPENLAVMCAECHFQYDNGNYHNEIKNLFKEHLSAQYEGWNEKELIYKKWSF